MIKGIEGYGYFDTLTIPIIENTAWEHELADSLGQAIANNPKACAVLVRRHGMYVWGNTWEQAKRHGECLHYLFDIAIRMKQLGLDFNAAPKPQSLNRTISCNKYKHLILDIEGTTTPITFVKDTLFPYAAAHLEAYLRNTWALPSTAALVLELAQQATADVRNAKPEDDVAVAQALSTHVGNLTATTEQEMNSALAAATAFALLCIKQDRKVTPLKKLQGLIWEQAYKTGKLSGTVYTDLLPMLERCKSQGIRVSIYSSGSKHAQQLLFGHSTAGDLRHFFSCYFDTSVGQKNSADSYKEILLTLGLAESADEVLFVTDILAEAQAASKAGMQAVISVRAGNAAINEAHPFTSITSFDQI